MEPLAARSLIDASAKLDPADRALIDLWLNRQLDDKRLAALTGMSVDAVVSRRARLITRLGDELGLSADEVLSGLGALANGGAPPPTPWSTNGRHWIVDAPPDTPPPADSQASAAGLLLGPAAISDPARASSAPGLLLGPSALAPARRDVAAPAGLLLGPGAARTPSAAPGVARTPSAAPGATAGTVPADASPTPRRRGPLGRKAIWLTSALATLMALVAVVILLASGEGGSRRQAAAQTTNAAPAPAAPASAAATTTSPATQPPASTPSAPPPTTAPSHPRSSNALVALPGGLAHVHGSVTLVVHRKHLRLKLRVSKLRAPRHGHYEVWLYNSVLNSQPLGRLRAHHRVDVYKLPRHADHYRWIDVSFQPPGYVNHSGESVLRAANPVRTAGARSGDASAGRRHASRRALRRSRKASTSK